MDGKNADYYINSIITQKFLSFLLFRQIPHSSLSIPREIEHRDR